MSFYTSLSGLKAAQTDLSTISNNVANVGSIGFKKSRAQFGDLFASGLNQTTKTVAGQGTRLNSIQAQFTQGTLENTDKTLDLAVAGEGFFVVKNPSDGTISYTRNGALSVDKNSNVVDTLGNRVQLLPVDDDGNVTGTTLSDFVIPQTDPDDATASLASISIDTDGVVSATYSNGTVSPIGSVAMASFDNMEGLRSIGDAHWLATGDSGAAKVGAANTGSLGQVRSGTLERANVDVTEELVSLIAAQRNFQANAKAIETANNMTQTINQIRS